MTRSVVIQLDKLLAGIALALDRAASIQKVLMTRRVEIGQRLESGRIGLRVTFKALLRTEQL
jgi:hypothetical protein